MNIATFTLNWDIFLREKLRSAAPNLHTFVRHKGIEPTNKSEQRLRKIVMHKKIRQMFGSVTGMNIAMEYS